MLDIVVGTGDRVANMTYENYFLHAVYIPEWEVDNKQVIQEIYMQYVWRKNAE